MARVWVDGFESGNLEQYYPVSYATIEDVTGSNVWSGKYILHKIYPSGDVSKTLSSALSEIFVKFRFLVLTTTGFLKFQDSDGTYILSISRNSSGSIVVHSGNFSTVIATSSAQIETNRVYLFEIRYVPLNSGGAIQIKIDNDLIIDYSGDTTNGLEDVQTISLTTTDSHTYFDDYVIDDSDWIGNTRIQAIVPNGAGNSTQWTPSTGSNYACVDEIPVSDTDYVSTNTVGNTDTYAFGNLTGSIESIKSVSAMARCGYNGEPTPTNVNIVARVSGTDYASADIDVPMSFNNLFNIWENNPATSAAWLESGVNGAEFGIKAAA